MFFRRGVSDRDPRFLQTRLWIFSAGAILALIGMGLQNDWLIGGAGLVLGVGILLGVLARRAPGGDDEGQ